MLLKNLIKNISKDKKDIFVSGITTNSKEVKKNYIFFAIKGNKINGENYIKEAIKKGASIIICSKEYKAKHPNITIIKKNDIRNFLSFISSKFYKLKPKNIIAVTGTNGKTSVADIFFQILKINKVPVASIGTLGIKYGNKTIKTNLTSPDTVSIHKYLNFLKKKGINNVIIEASSHGLDQKRLNHINFKAAVFTNFSQDHLDYHGSMSSYLNSKLKLFKYILKKKASIISDTEIKQFKLLKKIAKQKNLKIFGIKEEVEQIKKILLTNTTDYKIKNLSMATKAAKLCNIKNQSLYKSVTRLKDVSGRLELVKSFSNGIKVYIDYAHTPDALLKTLESLKRICSNNITIVFGCGGERDKKKRPLMAKIANANCKKVFITDDNPRNENPEKIRKTLSSYISKKKLFNIGNRSLAIKKAILNAEPFEVILIAGKGHEEYQIYKNSIKNISDKAIVKKIIVKKKVLSKKEINFLLNRKILKKILGKKILLNFNNLTLDTRTLQKNNLFLAFKGKKNDGNRYIQTALRKGAGCIITSQNLKYKRKKIVKIKKITQFLNKFAKFKRYNSSAKIIAITGSAGKTSLKNLTKNLLQNFGKTYCSPKSFNNHLGVPISLSNLDFFDKFGVFEVGMSRAGEIKKLSKLIKPHIGVITNVGEAHLENFKDIKGIAAAKSEIIENIVLGGTVILNRDDKFFNFLQRKAKSHNLKIITFGTHKNSDVRCLKIIKKRNTTKIFVVINSEVLTLEVKDLNIYNILASIAIIQGLKVDYMKIKSKFKKLDHTEGRGKLHTIKRFNKQFKLIDESYNANPLSVKNAIKRLNQINKEKFKKYLILGDMLELGTKSKKYHEELSKVINNSDIDKVFIKGKKTIFTYKHLNKDKRGNILQDNEDIDFMLSRVVMNNDYVMIKGSNATGLNTFSQKIIRGN